VEDLLVVAGVRVADVRPLEDVGAARHVRSLIGTRIPSSMMTG
jgi:hypothetical protein